MLQMKTVKPTETPKITEDAYFLKNSIVQVAELTNKLDEAEEQRLINKVLEESKEYTNLTNRISARKAREDRKVSLSIMIKSIVSSILIIVSSMFIYFCAGAFDIGTETLGTIILLVSSGLVLLIGLSVLFAVAYQYTKHYLQEKYTITYLNASSLTPKEYITKTTSAKKAYERFYNMYIKNQRVFLENIKITDEDGNEYNEQGILL